MALVVLFTVTLPLYLGQPPHAGAALVSNLVLAPLSGVVSLVSVPLVVLVQLAMRFAVIDDSAWRPAFGAAWRLAKTNLAEIAVAYVLLMLVTLLAVVAFAAVVAAAAAVVGALLLGIGTRRHRRRHRSRPGALRCGGPPDSPRSCSWRFRLSCSYGSPRCGRSSGATGPDAGRALMPASVSAQLREASPLQRPKGTSDGLRRHHQAGMDDHLALPRAVGARALRGGHRCEWRRRRRWQGQLQLRLAGIELGLRGGPPRLGS